ncbi:MAG: marR 1 [Streptosporangiaceae bacterium]|jgi:DNA-binding MarR family transcriptional regulator|nr:marR 1 [Streptosporangiaceae bacterium]
MIRYNTDMIFRRQEVGRKEVLPQSFPEHAQVAGEATDHVDEILEEWAIERPDLDLSAQGVVGRVLRLSRFFERALAAAFHQFGINGGEFDVLATLRRCGGETGLTASQLANRCMLSTAAMTNRLDRLEAMNLVERRSEPRDRRVVRVALTSKGRKLIDTAFTAHAENQDRTVAVFSAEERDLLAALLRRVLLTFEISTPTNAEDRAGPEQEHSGQ